MISLFAAVMLASQTPAAPPPALSDQARALIAPVAEAVAAEEARQAALPPAASDRERLERMGALDQVGRRAANPIDLSVLPEAERAAANAAMWTPLMALDDRLLAELLPMVPAEGWFRKSVYGEQAANAAFLIIQHSDIEQWRRFVPVLEPLVAAGEINGSQYGLMYDRLAVNEGRPQRYGTQMTCRAGKFVVDWDNIEDPANADARRAAVGFAGTLAEYETLFANYPPCEED